LYSSSPLILKIFSWFGAISGEKENRGAGDYCLVKTPVPRGNLLEFPMKLSSLSIKVYLWVHFRVLVVNWILVSEYLNVPLTVWSITIPSLRICLKTKVLPVNVNEKSVYAELSRTARLSHLPSNCVGSSTLPVVQQDIKAKPDARIRASNGIVIP